MSDRLTKAHQDIAALYVDAKAIIADLRARLDAAERERDALLLDAVVEELALTIAGCEFWDEGSTIYPDAYRDTARAALTAAMATARAALTANHSAPVVKQD